MTNQIHLILGLGETGLSVARYLNRRGIKFAVFDTREIPAKMNDFEKSYPNTPLYRKDFPNHILDNVSQIICSPGVSLDEPFIAEAMAKNIPICGDIDCLAQEINEPVVAITGTNGKSTVTTLVGEMAKASGKSVAVAGNIGIPVLDILDVGVKYDLWVLELSSFQLDLIHKLKPEASTILNITPDHLDRHHTFQAYVKSKQKIYEKSRTLIYNKDDQNTYPANIKADQKVLSYGQNEDPKDFGLIKQNNETYLAKGREKWLAVSQMHIRGVHNWMNALAASALAFSIGIDKKFIIEVLQRFTGLPHRCQWVRNLNGVDYINDSKATNVGATISALAGIGEAFTGKIILIAGGLSKGACFHDLASPLSKYARAIVLIGQDAHLIEDVVQDIKIIRAAHMEDAVKKASLEAERDDVVLLSPACASFDMFRDFNHRGDDFMSCVKALSLC